MPGAEYRSGATYIGCIPAVLHLGVYHVSSAKQVNDLGYQEYTFGRLAGVKNTTRVRFCYGENGTALEFLHVFLISHSALA